MSATHCPHCKELWDTHDGTQIGICIHGLDEPTARIWARRVADRLAGFTSAEVSDMHPYPEKEERL